MNIGASNRQIYDTCAYQKDLAQSVSPLSYRLYFGANENCSKCRDENFYVKYQPEIVDLESNLRLLTMPLSRCDQFKYNPSCKKSNMCTSTFDKSNPVIMDRDVCSVVYNNIPKRVHPGYHLPNPNPCVYRK